MKRNHKICRQCKYYCYSPVRGLDPCWYGCVDDVKWKKTRKMEVPDECLYYMEQCMWNWNMKKRKHWIDKNK